MLILKRDIWFSVTTSNVVNCNVVLSYISYTNKNNTRHCLSILNLGSLVIVWLCLFTTAIFFSFTIGNIYLTHCR